MRRATLLLLPFGLLLAVACTGPDNRDDTDATASAQMTPTSDVQVASEPTEADDQSANPTRTAAERASPEATEDEEDAATATATGTPTPSPTPTEPEATPTEAATPMPTPLPIGLEESLSPIEQLGDPGFFLANQGSLSALDLANSYSDSSSHLERLDNWGFKEHLFREFGRDATGPDDPVPTYVLVTVNEYGSPEQAAEAMEWLRTLNSSQGHEFVEPPPEFGDLTIASSVATADGTPSSIVFVQLGPRVYAYFALAGQPLDFVLRIAEENTRRIEDAGQEDGEGAQVVRGGTDTV